jgi:hypothetical protein
MRQAELEKLENEARETVTAPWKNKWAHPAKQEEQAAAILELAAEVRRLWALQGKRLSTPEERGQMTCDFE